MKKTLLAIATTLTFGYANAQMKVGSNPTVTSPTANLEVEATNGEKVIVEKATSRVGIGITSPSTKLHIAGALTTQIETVGTFNDILHVTGPSWGFGDKSRTLSWSYNLAGSPGGDGLHLFIPANVNPAAAYTDAVMNFYTDNGGANKVGINTINPATTLDVNGTTKTTNLQVVTGAGTGKILTSDASGNATWQTPSGGGIVGILQESPSAIGTTAVSIAAGTTADIPGATVTINPTVNVRVLITVSALPLPVAATSPVQGSIDLLQNGTKIASQYYSSTDAPSALVRLGNYSTITKVLNLTPGSYTFKIQAKSWYNSTQFNIDPVALGYVGAIASDVDAMKASITIMSYTR